MAKQFFSKVQFGKETVSGTAVAADTKFVGQSQPITPDRQIIFPVEQMGYRAESHRVITSNYLVQHSLSSEHGYFQALPVLLGCSLKGGVTSSEQTADQDDYLWAFAPSFASGVSNAPDSLTLECGDDTQAWEAEYAVFSALHLSGEVPQAGDAAPVNISAEYFARQWTKTTFSAVSDAAVTSMNAKLARLYVDTAWAGVGGTEKTNVLRGFTLDIMSGLEPGFAGSANKYFNAVKEGLLGAMLTVTLERGATSNALFDSMLAGTFQVVRLEINGPQIGSGDPHQFQFDLGGYWETVSPMDGTDDNGTYTDTLALKGVYDATGAKVFQASVTTNIEAY